MKLLAISSLSIPAILLSAVLAAPAVAQTTETPAPPPQASSTTSTATANSSNTEAISEPLSTKSNEGFWGHLNPFARKKWVRRQTNPIKDRLNELDELNAREANQIKDVDARAKAGIQKAQSTADQANTQATEASSTAGHAQTLAQQANSQTAELNTAVTNLDHYTPVTKVELRFSNSQIRLNQKAKDALDQIAAELIGQKGYLVDVQGYSQLRGRAGMARSKNMTDAVVRYLVIEHQVPVYRIYHVAMGDAPVENEARTRIRGTVVHVTLMHNSLAELNTPVSTDGGSPIGATQQPTMQPSPSPRSAASQPN